MAFVENLADFLTDFGISVAFKRVATPLLTSTLILNAPPEAVAIYDRSFYDEKFYEASVRLQDVELLGVESALTALQLNDIATVNSVEWYVTGIIPDGTGMVAITLSINTV